MAAVSTRRVGQSRRGRSRRPDSASSPSTSAGTDSLEALGQAQLLGAPLHLDVLAAVRYLRKAGVKTVSIVGGSMGGDAAADASAESDPGEIDRLVLLAGDSYTPPEKLKGRKLFVVSRDDLGSGDIPRLPKIKAQYEIASEPKELIILDGSAHAQFIFQTAQGDRLMREILRFLSAP